MGAWVAVALLSMIPEPSQIVLAPFFPVGLLALLPRGEEKAITAYMLVTPCLLGWAFYAAITWAIFSVPGKKSFFAVYCLFCLVLALNVVGCKRTLEAAAGIH